MIIIIFILLSIPIVYLMVGIIKSNSEFKKLSKILNEQDIEIEKLIKICEKEIDKQFKDRKKYYEDL